MCKDIARSFHTRYLLNLGPSAYISGLSFEGKDPSWDWPSMGLFNEAFWWASEAPEMTTPVLS